MSASRVLGRATNLFDLNIEEVLEHWEKPHALRELIANALDEQYLTQCAPTEIYRDDDYIWHIRDHGRGLRIEHFTQNENPEKLSAHTTVIGKFGVGLKDALATLHRHNVEVIITSTFGTFQPCEAQKHGYEGIQTLHIAHSDLPAISGTDIALRGITDADIATAKSFFLAFNQDTLLETTVVGEILERSDAVARIYLNGVLANEEPNFLFSYNVTHLTAGMKKRLNRERQNVGRTVYAERVKTMLCTATSPAVCDTLADQATQRASREQSDEMRWGDVSQRAFTLLQERREVTFLTAAELEAEADLVQSMRSDGYEVVVVSDAQAARLEGRREAGETDLRTLNGYVLDYNASFEYSFVEPSELRGDERAIFARTDEIVGLVWPKHRDRPPVRVSETMRAGADCTVGVWSPERQEIIIVRRQLRSLAEYAGTLLHEAAHAATGESDSTREFETVLTEYLGLVAERLLVPIAPLPSSIKPEGPTDTEPMTVGCERCGARNRVPTHVNAARCGKCREPLALGEDVRPSV